MYDDINGVSTGYWSIVWSMSHRSCAFHRCFQRIKSMAIQRNWQQGIFWIPF